MTGKPVIAITKLNTITIGDVHKVSCTATRSVPEGYEVIEQGILEGTSSDESLYTYDSESVKRYAGNDTELNGATTLNIKVSSDDKTIYFRGYMIVLNKATGNEGIYYTVIQSRSYNG